MTLSPSVSQAAAADEPRRLRLLFAEDDPLLSSLMQDLLGQDFDIVGTASDGKQILAAAEHTAHDIILLDISMPLLNGFAVARSLRAQGNSVPIIFVTEHDDQDYLNEALHLGANGYVLKRRAVSELVEAIREVGSGHIFISPAIRHRFAAGR